MSQDRKPDWNFWSFVPNVSILKGVALSLNIDPNRINYHARDGMMGIKDLNESHEFGERIILLLKNKTRLRIITTDKDEPEKSEATTHSIANLLLAINRTIPPEMAAIAEVEPVSAYDEWLVGKGERSTNNAEIMTLKRQVEELTADRDDWKAKAEQFERQINAGRDHYSEKLAYLIQAAGKYWNNVSRKDRATHINNDEVENWLIQRGFSATLAKKGATIIRPEWAPTGRKPEE